MNPLQKAHDLADAHLATLKREGEVLDDIRAILIQAGDYIASGRIKDGKDLVDDLVRVLGGKDAA